MKIVAQIFLLLFFVIAFFIGLFAASLKFQLLDYSFWQTTFVKHNVYQNLADAGKSAFESQIVSEGGNKNDVKVLTDLITTDNTKDFVNRNLQNLLSFANGKSLQINVYLPIDKVPKTLLPKNISGVKSDMTLTELLTKFNFQDWQNLPLQNLSQLGMSAAVFFACAVAFLLLASVLLILLTENGKRFIGLGIALVLSGSLTLLLVQIGSGLQTAVSADLLTKSSVASVLAGTLVPPVLAEIVSVWQILGIILLVAGIGLFFIRKPSYNVSK